MRDHRQLLTQALWLTGGAAAVRLLFLGLQGCLNRHLGEAGLGLLQLISSLGMLGLLLGSGGLRVSVMILCGEELGRGNRRGAGACIRLSLSWGLALSSTAGGVLLLCRTWAARVLLKAPEAEACLGILGLFLPLHCLCGILQGCYMARGRIRTLLGAELLEALCSVAVTVTLLHRWAGGDRIRGCCAAILGSAMGAALTVALLIPGIFRDFPERGRPAGLEKRLLRASVPAALHEALGAGLRLGEQLLIPWGLEAGGLTRQEAMGAYGVLHGLVFPLLMCPAVFLFSLSDLLIPALARSRAGGEPEKTRSLARRLLLICGLFSTAVGLIFGLWGPGLGERLFGSPPAGRLLRGLAPLAVILYTDAVTDGMLRGLGRQRACLRCNICTALLDMLLLRLLLPSMGLRGYVLAATLTRGLNLWVSLGLLRRAPGMGRPGQKTFRSQKRGEGSRGFPPRIRL